METYLSLFVLSASLILPVGGGGGGKIVYDQLDAVWFRFIRDGLFFQPFIHIGKACKIIIISVAASNAGTPSMDITGTK